MANGPGNSSKAPSAIKDPKEFLTKSNRNKNFGLLSKTSYFVNDRFAERNTNSHRIRLCIYCRGCSGTSDIKMKKEEIVL